MTWPARLAVHAGITFDLARTRPGTRADERAIKHAGGARRYCPLCTPTRSTAAELEVPGEKACPLRPRGTGHLVGD
jgi:hypothetical protein